MRIGYCTWGMKGLDVESALPAIAEIGYQGIELAVTPGWSTELYTLDAAQRKRIARLLETHDLILTAVAAHTSMCEEDAERKQANLQRLRGAIDLAAELAQEGEQPIAVSLVGGDEGTWEACREIVAQRVHALGEYAASRGAILAVEPHCGTAFDTPDKAIWLMERVNHPAVRLNFDISHFDILGIGINACVPHIAPYSVHTHVKDQRGRYPDHEFLTPGRGPFDFAHYVRAMHQAGYSGFIGIEVSVMVQRQPGYDALADAALGYRTLVRAFKEAGVPLDR